MADMVLARAIVEVGAPAVADVKSKIGTLETTLKKLEAGYTAGRVSVDSYLRKSAELRSEIDRLKGGLSAAEAAITKYGSAQAAAGAMAKQVGQQTKSAGMGGAMGLLILSQAIDDVQYGRCCRAA